MKTFFVALVVAVVAFAAGVWYTREYRPSPVPEIPATTMQDTNPTTTPSVLKATYTNASTDTIVVTAPLPGAKVGHTFSVTGKARGGWYFEASFPLNVLASDDSLLKEMPVQADGNWMTADFVPFEGTVTLPATYHGAATLVLKKDNPSGLPENEASISIPIIVE